MIVFISGSLGIIHISNERPQDTLNATQSLNQGLMILLSKCKVNSFAGVTTILWPYSVKSETNPEGFSLSFGHEKPSLLRKES